MTDLDFEDLVREAIAHGTSGEASTDLADAVRRRARVRRRRTTGFVAATAAVSVAVVALVTSQLAGTDQEHQPDALATDTVSPAPTGPVAPGWRVESWHDVQVEVPDDWIYDSRSQWCTMNSRPDGWRVPRVWRSDQVDIEAHCPEPLLSYGLSFGSSALVDLAQPSGSIWQYGDQGVYPEGAWLSIVVEGDVAVSVAAPDRDSVERIVDSVDRVEGPDAVDANGCFPKAGRAEGRAVPVPGTVSVCQYLDGLWLTRSERLEGADAEAAVAALDAAPTQDFRPCPLDKVPPPSIELVTTEGVADLQWSTSCTGVYWKNSLRKLTAELMYWALSPGSQGPFPGDVPYPVPRRS